MTATSIGWARVFDLTVPLLSVAVWGFVLILAAWGGGSLWWRLSARTHQANASDAVQILAMGAGTLMAATGVAGGVGLLRGWLLITILAFLAARGGVLLARGRPRAFPLSLRSPWWLLAAVSTLVTALAVTTPSSFFDQWHYHLGFPFQWLREGRLSVFGEHVYSFLPSNMGLLYAYGLAGPGIWAAQATNWWMGVLGAVGTVILARRLGCRAAVAPLAGALFLTAPTVVEMAVTAGSDLGVATFFVAGCLAVRDAVSSRARDGAAVRAGVFAGLAVGCKYLALVTVAVPLGGMLGLVALRTTGVRRVVGSLRAGALCTAAAVVVFSPWAIRNTVRTGNPLYPYLGGVFAAEGRTSEDGGGAAAGVGETAVAWDKLTALMGLGAVQPRGLAGDPGPLFLWLVPLWVLAASNGRFRTLHRIFLAGFVAASLGWALAPPLGRYLAPILAVVAAGAAAGFGRSIAMWPRSVRQVATALVALAALSNLNPVRSVFLAPQLRGTFGLQEQDAAFRAGHSGWAAVEYINSRLPGDARVLLVAEARVWGLERAFMVRDPFRRSVLSQLAGECNDAEAMVGELRRRGVTHLLINWAEAQRIAAMMGRTDYFALASSSSRSALQELLTERLVPVFSDRSATLYRVPGPEDG